MYLFVKRLFKKRSIVSTFVTWRAEAEQTWLFTCHCSTCYTFFASTKWQNRMKWTKHYLSNAFSLFVPTETSWGPKRRLCSWWPCSSSLCFTTASRWDHPSFNAFIISEIWSFSNCNPENNHLKQTLTVEVSGQKALMNLFSKSY